MLRVVYSRLTRQWSRYALVVVCVAVCAAFMTAALGLASTLSASLASDLAAPYKNADAVVTSSDEGEAPAVADAQQIRKLEELPQVQTAWTPHTKLAHATNDTSDSGLGVTFLSDVPSDTSLLPAPLTEGSFPETAQQVVTTEKAATDLGLRVGDTVRFEEPGEKGGPSVEYTLSGLTETTASSGVPDWYTSSAGLERMLGTASAGVSGNSAILLRTDGSPSQSELDSLNSEVNRILGTGRQGCRRCPCRRRSRSRRTCSRTCPRERT